MLSTPHIFIPDISHDDRVQMPFWIFFKGSPWSWLQLWFPHFSFYCFSTLFCCFISVGAGVFAPGSIRPWFLKCILRKSWNMSKNVGKKLCAYISIFYILTKSFHVKRKIFMSCVKTQNLMLKKDFYETFSPFYTKMCKFSMSCVKSQKMSFFTKLSCGHKMSRCRR